MRDRVLVAVLGLAFTAGCAGPADDATHDSVPTGGLVGLGTAKPDPAPVVARLVAQVDPRFALLDPTLVARWAGETCADLRDGRAPDEVTGLAAARFSADTTAGRITINPGLGALVVAGVAPSCWAPTR